MAKSHQRGAIVLRNSFLLFLCLLGAPAYARAQPAAARFDKTAEMVRMRDGIKLHTLVHAPKDAKEKLPFLLVRTPYGIEGRFEGMLRGALRELAKDGYIFVFQDVRGRFKSEGEFAMMGAGKRDKSDPKSTDDTTDAYDTIDWLLKNVPNNNGRAGIFGVSYPGWTAAMALVDPHPALKAASPQSSPIDKWLGDDFHHNGAFRLSYGLEYVAMMETDKKNSDFQFDMHDTYEWYLKLGALSNVNEKYFKGRMPTWNDFVAHPHYDAFWKKQSLAPNLTAAKVPTLNVTGWYDQEDFRGPLKIYETLEGKDAANHNFLVVGPWNHGGWNYDHGELGRIKFGADTARHFREKIQAPFFAHHLKEKEKPELAEAVLFQTGSNKWVSHDKWPVKDAVTKRIFFHPNGKLAFEPPAAEGSDGYRSDPANPVPYRPRPVRPTYPGPEWRTWMMEDQRFTHRRPDVLSYESEPLTEDLVIGGSMTAKLFANTTGTDADWIVRLIDVYPEEVKGDASMGGFQFLVSGEPIRGRYRKSFEKPEPIEPGKVEEYAIDLHWGHHCFRKGHRIMVQVSSTWFPLIDRNPQKYVENIFKAVDADFQPADQKVFRSPGAASHVELQVVPVGK